MCLHNTNHITRVLAGSAQAGFAWARLEVHYSMQSIRSSKNGTGCFIGWCSRRVALSCPKEPATGTQACSPCCTPTWSGRMRHWIARARARRDPMLCSSRNTRAALSCDPQTRDTKWARGSRSQTHRRASKGCFTQDDGYVQGVAPDALRSTSSGSFSNTLAAEQFQPL